MHYYKHHIGDMQRDTAHLTLQEDATYRRLIDYYMEREQPISADTAMVARRIRSTKRLVDSILNEFFDATDDGWIHPRYEQELKRLQSVISAAKTNGSIGGKSKSQKTLNNQAKDHSECLADAKRTPSESVADSKLPINPLTHLPINKDKPPKSPNGEGAIDGFDEFWSAYKKTDGKEAARRAWVKNKCRNHLAEILEALEWQTRQPDWIKENKKFMPHGSTYLNNRRWEDERPSSMQSKAPVKVGKPMPAAL